MNDENEDLQSLKDFTQIYINRINNVEQFLCG